MRQSRHCFFITIFSLSSLFCNGQTSLRKKINIDDNWKFHFGNAADPVKDFNYSIATVFSKSGGAFGTTIDSRFNDSSWRTLNLPHDWGVELPFVNVKSFEVELHGYKPVGGLFPETSIGWYRKHFIIPATDSGEDGREYKILTVTMCCVYYAYVSIKLYKNNCL